MAVPMYSTDAPAPPSTSRDSRAPAVHTAVRHRVREGVAMRKSIPGAADIQSAIDAADAAIQRAHNGKSDEMDMLVSVAGSLQQLACGTKQALQAIYDEVARS